jgi:hypothetical protein
MTSTADRLLWQPVHWLMQRKQFTELGPPAEATVKPASPPARLNDLQRVTASAGARAAR